MEGSPAVEREHSLCRGRRAENEEGAQGWRRRPGPEPRWLDGSSLENLNTLPALQARLVRGWRREPVSPGPALTGACDGRSVAGREGKRLTATAPKGRLRSGCQRELQAVGSPHWRQRKEAKFWASERSLE